MYNNLFIFLPLENRASFLFYFLLIETKTTNVSAEGRWILVFLLEKNLYNLIIKNIFS